MTTWCLFAKYPRLSDDLEHKLAVFRELARASGGRVKEAAFTVGDRPHTWIWADYPELPANAEQVCSSLREAGFASADFVDEAGRLPPKAPARREQAATK
jgi:hypothetical protein